MAENNVRQITIRFTGGSDQGDVTIGRFGAKTYTSPSARSMIRLNRAMEGMIVKFVSFGDGGIVLDVVDEEKE